MPNNTQPTWLQNLWASPLGGLAQGAIIDPVLGTDQLFVLGLGVGALI